jgi:hypothetical protein
MEKIMQFFNYSLPCPVEFANCEALRVEYQDSLEQLKRSGGCSKCVENRIKNDFIIKLQNIMANKS